MPGYSILQKCMAPNRLLHSTLNNYKIYRALDGFATSLQPTVTIKILPYSAIQLVIYHLKFY